MIIELATQKDQQTIAKLDSHIPQNRLEECIENGQVYVLKDDSNLDKRKNSVMGILRYSLFWQTIPFLDLLYIDEPYRRQGLGTLLMQTWERDLQRCGYSYAMTSTQADEDAWQFYEKLDYRRAGGFYPPQQSAEEWVYLKELKLQK